MFCCVEEEIEEILVRETAETGVVIQSVPRGMQSVDSGSICDDEHITLPSAAHGNGQRRHKD